MKKKAVFLIITLLAFGALTSGIIITSVIGGNNAATPDSNISSAPDKYKLIRAYDKIALIGGELNTSEEAVNASLAISGIAGELSDDDLVSVIKDASLESVTKSAVVRLANKINKGSGIENQSRFNSFIADEKLDFLVRRELLDALDTSKPETYNILVNIIQSRSELGFSAVHALLRDSPSKALQLSDKIILTFEKYDNEVIRAAVQVKSQYLRDMFFLGNDVSDEREKFTSFCLARLKGTKNIKTDTYRNTLISSLSEIQDIRAVRLLIMNDLIDRDMKVSCIDQNSGRLEDLLKGDLTGEDIDFILTAMEIMPLWNLRELIESKILKNPSFRSERAEKVLLLIDTQGIMSTGKWEDYTPSETKWK